MSERRGRISEPTTVGPEVRAAEDAWGEARELLYRAFAGVPRPSQVPGCSHCVPEDADRLLLAVPVSQLPAAALGRYAFKAITTWGDAEHLRYFAPRLIECVVEAAAEFPAPEVTLAKLAVAGWLDWPAEQVDAVRRSLLAWWELTLAGAGQGDADSVLCAVAATGVDLGPYLATWSRFSTETSTSLLERLITRVDWSPPPSMTNPFWRNQPQAERQLLGWLTEGDAASALAAAFQQATDEARLDRLATLHTWLSRRDPRA